MGGYMTAGMIVFGVIAGGIGLYMFLRWLFNMRHYQELYLAEVSKNGKVWADLRESRKTVTSLNIEVGELHTELNNQIAKTGRAAGIIREAKILIEDYSG